MSQLTKGYLIGIVGIVIWSTTGIFIGYLINTYGMPPLSLAFWRNVLVFAAMLPVLFFIRRSLVHIERTQIKFFVLYGLVLALFNSIWVLSVQANGAAVSTVLAYSSAGFTAVFAWWVFKERLGLPKILAVILSLVGCVLVSNAYDPVMWTRNPLGIITGIISGIAFAAYNMMGKEAARRKLNPWTTLLYSFAFGSAFMLVFNLIPVAFGTTRFEKFLPNLPPTGWLILVILSLGPTLLGFGLYNTAMNYLSASTASLLATTEPAFTAVEAYLFLNERMTVVQIVGSVIIFSAVLIARLEKEPTPAVAPATTEFS